MSFLTPLTEDCCQVMWANEEKDTCLAEGAAVPQLGKEAGPPPPPSSLGGIPGAAATLEGCQHPPGPLWL